MPVFIFKPFLLVAGHPMLDHALGDADLLDLIERTLRERGMDLYRDN